MDQLSEHLVYTVNGRRPAVVAGSACGRGRQREYELEPIRAQASLLVFCYHEAADLRVRQAAHSLSCIHLAETLLLQPV